MAPEITRAVPDVPGFDREAYDRFRIPRRLGEAISGWDDPEMASASEAHHMRQDDYVVGLVFRGSARAYPIWVVDNYHVVNDRVDGERFFVTSCERCQSGSAFVAQVGGKSDREPLFRSVGFLNATLLLKDFRTASHWIHFEGFALDRLSAGTRLPWIPAYHMEWKDWVALHPDTTVMVPPADPGHPDARHGHGREEFFSRPGMDPAFLLSVLGPLDSTYPENEMVLGIEGESDWFGYPLREVQREGGVVHDTIDGDRIVVLAGPRPDGFTMAAFATRAAGRELSFDREDGAFRDRETGSRWTIEGNAIEGLLACRRLEPVRAFYVRWHALIYNHRDIRLYRSKRWPPKLGEHDPNDTSRFEPFLSALAARGHGVRIGGPMVSQRRPRESESSLTVYVDGHRLNLHAFSSERAARDFDAFEGAWSGLPLRERSLDGKTRRIGRFVIESDPEERHVDPAQVIPIPPGVVRWAPVLDSGAIEEIARGSERPDRSAPEPGFLDLVRGLRLSGFEVLEIGFLPPGQLRAGCVNAIALTIDGERFLLYRFATSEQACGYAATERHSRAMGPYVIRSTPDTMYEHQLYEILYAGDESIRWSALLDTPAFVGALERVVGTAGG